jgi:hypothetical protein
MGWESLLKVDYFSSLLDKRDEFIAWLELGMEKYLSPESDRVMEDYYHDSRPYINKLINIAKLQREPHALWLMINNIFGHINSLADWPSEEIEKFHKYLDFEKPEKTQISSDPTRDFPQQGD